MKKLCKTADFKRGQNIRQHALAAENFRYINAVHDRREHSDLVGLHAVDFRARASSPEIAAADDDAHLRSLVYKSLHLQRDAADRLLVKSGSLAARQRFSAEFQDNSAHDNIRSLLPV